ncbi:MAG TPA: response regulator [Longimicrobiales bacterium]
MSAFASTILIADDHEDSRAIIRTMLEHYGRRVLEAWDGEECLRKARAAHPDVIVLDLVLPILNGWETARALRQDPETAQIPILAFTAAVLPEQRERAIQAGCDAVLVKPASPTALLSAIDTLLASAQRPLSAESSSRTF